MVDYLYRFVIVAVILCFSLCAFAQSEFNLVIEKENEFYRNEILHEADDAYYTIGWSNRGTNISMGIHVSKHDKISGEIIKNTYLDIDSTWSFLDIMTTTIYMI